MSVQIFIHARQCAANHDLIDVEVRKTWWSREALQTRSRTVCELTVRREAASEHEMLAEVLEAVAAHLLDQVSSR